jgi:hypothetical protein
MNIEPVSRLLPACGDRWLPVLVADAFTVEHPIPSELECILKALESGGSGVERMSDGRIQSCLFERAAS